MQRQSAAAILAVAALCPLAVLAVRGPRGLAQEDALESPPSAETLQAVRLLLSGDRKEQAKGDAALKRMGPAAASQLRYWIRKVESEADRVRLFLETNAGGAQGAAARPMTADALFQRQLLEARSRSRGGEHHRALAIAEAILLLDPSTPHAWELRRLARRSREAIAAKELLEPTLEAEKLVYEIGEELQATFRLLNHRQSEAIIEIQKEVLGEVDVTVTLCGIDGSQRREQTRLRLRAPKDVDRIVLGPRRLWEQQIPIEIHADMPLVGAVARVQIGGKFRPTAWRVDGAAESGNLGLTIGECELWIVPPGEGSGAANPLEKVALAVLLKKEESFFVGAQLGVWAAEEDAYFNEKLLRTLLDPIGDLDPAQLRVAARILTELTGEDFGADAARWREWWDRFPR